MKRYFAGVLIVIMVLSLLGCGGGSLSDKELIKATITKYYQGIKVEDIDMVASCIDEEYSNVSWSTKENFLNALQLTFVLVDFHEITVSYGEILISNDTAVAFTNVIIDSTSPSGRETTAVDPEFLMVKRGSSWYIKGEV